MHCHMKYEFFSVDRLQRSLFISPDRSSLVWFSTMPLVSPCFVHSGLALVLFLRAGCPLHSLLFDPSLFPLASTRSFFMKVEGVC